METPIKRLFEKLGRHGPEARNRTAAVNRVWIAHWTIREGAALRIGLGLLRSGGARSS